MTPVASTAITAASATRAVAIDACTVCYGSGQDLRGQPCPLGPHTWNAVPGGPDPSLSDSYGYLFARQDYPFFKTILADQDYPIFEKNNNPKEAAATIGSCNVKIFMKVEDPTETYDLFKTSVSAAGVSSGGFKRESDPTLQERFFAARPMSPGRDVLDIASPNRRSPKAARHRDGVRGAHGKPPVAMFVANWAPGVRDEQRLTHRCLGLPRTSGHRLES